MYCKEANEENYPFKITYGKEVKYMYPDLVIKGKEVIYINPVFNEKIDIYYKYYPEKEDINDFFKNNPNSFLLVKKDTWNDYGYRSEFTFYLDIETSIGCKIISLNQKSYHNHDTHGVFENYENNKIDFFNLKDKILTRFYEYKTLIDKCPNLYLYVLYVFNDYSYVRFINSDKLNLYRNNSNFENSFIRYTNEKDIFFEEFPLVNIIIDFKYKIKENNIDKIKQKFYEMAFNEDIKENKLILPKYSGDDKLKIESSKNNTTTIEYWNIGLLLQEYIND